MKMTRLKFIGWGLFLLLTLALSACQSQPVEPNKAEVPEPNQQSTAQQSTAQQSTAQQSTAQQSTAQQSTAQQNTTQQGSAAVPPAASDDTPTDPAVIEAHWQSSPHANAFVQDANGQNNTCARCHAPINWSPSMDELPESCFACKFELEDPPPFISENEWTSIPCKVCHKENKDDTIQPEIAWLEIAPLEEYTPVLSPTELCQKCHAPMELAGHGDVNLGGAHPNYECTACHSAHKTTASCVTEACHSNVVEPADPIPGHDADHQNVSCVACHDGSGMEVGPDTERDQWSTFTVDSVEAGSARYAFTSHNIVLESKCDRCHFADNPWQLSTGVETP